MQHCKIFSDFKCFFTYPTSGVVNQEFPSLWGCSTCEVLFEHSRADDRGPYAICMHAACSFQMGHKSCPM